MHYRVMHAHLHESSFVSSRQIAHSKIWPSSTFLCTVHICSAGHAGMDRCEDESNLQKVGAVNAGAIPVTLPKGLERL